MSERSPATNRLHVVYNPVSTNHELAEPVIEWLTKDTEWADNYLLSETQSANVFQNVDDLCDEIQPDDIIVPFGGDGTLGMTAWAVKKAGKSRETYVVPAPYGNINDAAIYFYGKDFRGKDQALLDIVDDGQPQMRTGIEVRTIEPGSMTVRYAMNYAGLGKHARVAQAVDSPDFRERKKASRLPHKVPEGLETWGIIKEYDSFKYIPADSNTEKEASDVLYNALGRMADFFKFRIPEGEVIRNEFPAPRARYFGTLAWRLATEHPFGGLKGEPFESEQFTLTTPSLLQLDGEAIPVESGTVLLFRKAPNMVQVLLTKAD